MTPNIQAFLALTGLIFSSIGACFTDNPPMLFGLCCVCVGANGVLLVYALTEGDD